MESELQRYDVRSVRRALALLKAFTVEESHLSLTELAGRLGLNRSTTFRLLSTLQHEGFVQQNKETGKYSLGIGCLGLGAVFLDSVPTREIILPFLKHVRNECGETVHLGILDGDTMEVVYLEKLDGILPIVYMASRVGGRAPAYCTGVGKVLLAYEDPERVAAFYAGRSLQRYTPTTLVDRGRLLAHLEEIRKVGLAVDNEEHEPGVKCLAAPIVDGRGNVIAAFSVSGPAERLSAGLANGILQRLVKSTAAEISVRLGGRPIPITHERSSSDHPSNP